ncbi:RlpA-like double-psi beta-barrel domain-containing protein [Streptomyces liangshanensis]|uniref:hypothetical protein n=1 Tax=Streptomyces liangshanensis TaxID=2717324 RepID=UPI0036DD1875
MSRKKTLSRKKKISLLVGAAALVGGTAVVMTGTSQASVACDGFATALGNNEAFIAGQRSAPDAQSEARIANRVAVIEQIKVQQKASGCRVGEGGKGVVAGGAVQAPPAVKTPPVKAAPVKTPPAQQQPAAGGAGNGAGQVVCPGSTVTLFNEEGAPGASSGQFPIGTTLRVTNLDNSKSTTVKVTSTSASCVLLNNAAFEQVREPGKFLIRKARIERVG